MAIPQEVRETTGTTRRVSKRPEKLSSVPPARSLEAIDRVADATTREIRGGRTSLEFLERVRQLPGE